MGLFNRLFGSNKSIAEESKLDAAACLELWKEHLTNSAMREEISKHFSYKNVDAFLQDAELYERILAQLEDLISKDLVSIEGEVKNEEEIIADLKSLVASDRVYATSHIPSIVARQQRLLEIFGKLYFMLKTELHAIRLLRRNPKNAREILLYLFKLVFHDEPLIYSMFRPENYSTEDLGNWEDIQNITKAILVGETLREDARTAERAFISLAVKHMGQDSKHKYRRLAERVYYELLEMIGAPFQNPEDIMDGVQKLEEFISYDNLLRKLIVKNKGRQKMTNDQVEWMIRAFRKSYGYGHF